MVFNKKNFYEKEEKMLVFSFIIIDYVCDHNFRVIIRHHFVLMDEHKSNISTHNELKRKGNSYPIFRIYGRKEYPKTLICLAFETKTVYIKG